MDVRQSHRGLRDWIAQRTTAVIIGVYAIFLMSYVLLHAPLSYSIWHDLFSGTIMKVATLLVILSILWHAWIGLWTVFTDYVKPAAVRLLLEILVIVALFGYLAWCIDILWG